jgi:hypothetical protein
MTERSEVRQAVIPARRLTVVGFVVAGLAAALLLAFFVGPLASSSPDGLERVATDKSFIDTAEGSAVAGSPLADYAVSGVDDEGISTALAGTIGVAVTFVLGCGLFLVIRMVRRQRPAVATT